MFVNELDDDDMDDDLFHIHDIAWEDIIESHQITERVKEIIHCIPECVPFRIRALLFNDYVTQERYKYKGNRYRVRINREDLFDDGFQTLSQVDDLKGTLIITFVNHYGIEEEGQDAGGIFKEFLVELTKIIFEPNFGFFTKTEIDEDLFPNPSNSLHDHLEGDRILEYYSFFGRILGKAMFEGIQIEPQFAKFFLKKLANKSNMISDLKSLDKDLFKNLNFLKTYDGDYEDL